MVIEDLKSTFRVVIEQQSELGGKVDALTHDVAIIKEDLREVKTSQDIMRGDISKLDARQTRMEKEITEMKGDITVMKGDISVMKGDISKLNAGQSRMEKDITEIKRELKSIRSEMTEFRALLSQKADIERFNRLEERVARIEQELQQRQ